MNIILELDLTLTRVVFEFGPNVGLAGISINLTLTRVVFESICYIYF